MPAVSFLIQQVECNGHLGIGLPYALRGSLLTHGQVLGQEVVLALFKLLHMSWGYSTVEISKAWRF